MKKFIAFFLLLFFFLFVFLINLETTTTSNEAALPEVDKLAYREIRKVGKQLQQKYGLKLSGEGLEGNNDKIKKIIVSFDAKFLLPKNKARSLLVNCIEEFLKEINSFEKIKPFLDTLPMTYKDLEFTIFFFLPSGYESVHPDLCYVMLNNGIIKYKTNDPEDRFKYYSTEKETYEEALKIVESETI